MTEMKADDTGKSVVPVLACVLHQLCTRNDRLPVSQKNITKFHALRPPAISIKDYLNRIAKYAACSGECFVLALVYVDRIIQSNPTFVVNSLNIHRLLITSVMLAAKFFDDQYYNNAYYAKVGGVPCVEMNSLEVDFLFMTNFTLFVATDTYRQYYTELCNHAMNSSCGCATQPLPKLIVPAGPVQIPDLDWDDIETRCLAETLADQQISSKSKAPSSTATKLDMIDSPPTKAKKQEQPAPTSASSVSSVSATTSTAAAATASASWAGLRLGPQTARPASAQQTTAQPQVQRAASATRKRDHDTEMI